MKVKENQSVFDLAAQNFGDVRAVIEFVRKNNLSLTQELASGDLVSSEISTKYVENDVVNYFESKERNLTTGTPLANIEVLGIGTMRINSSFIVTKS
jgi:hypothetical protein